MTMMIPMPTFERVVDGSMTMVPIPSTVELVETMLMLGFEEMRLGGFLGSSSRLFAGWQCRTRDGSQELFVFVCGGTADHATVLALGERDRGRRSRVFGRLEFVEVVCERKGDVSYC